MEFVGWWRENDKRHASSTVSKGKCLRVAMASAGEGMCGGLLRRALTFSSGAGSKFRMQPEKRPRLVPRDGAKGRRTPEMEGRSAKVKPAP